MKEDHLIFVEPPEDVDETWVHGAMLGGMSGYDDQSLAHSYFVAGEMLIEKVLKSGERGQEVICPILYLYRHGIELHLKVLMKPAKLNHSISSLLDAFSLHVQSKYGEQVPTWLTDPVGQLAKFDPNSDLFRYGTTKKPEVMQWLANTGEYWIDLRKLGKTMSLVEQAFIRVGVAEVEGLEGLKRFVRHA
jgi:hypothetical protein